MLVFVSSLFKRLIFLSLFPASAMLVACAPKPSDEYDYLQRLSNILNVNISKQDSTVEFPNFPQPRQLTIELQQNELSIREFLSLRECALHTTIAHRNSLIGKVASESQLLFNDLRILEQGPACLKLLGKKSIAKKLTSFLEEKQSQLAKQLWLAVLAQDEHRKFWRSKDYRGSYPEIVELDPHEHLNKIAGFVVEVLNGKTKYSNNDFNTIEQHLGQLRFGDGGQLLANYIEQINALEQANSIIKKRLEQPLCLNKKTTTKARYFENVVNSFFIKLVQTRAVKLNQRADVLLKQHQRLESPLLIHANEAYKTWARQRDAVIAEGKKSIKKHVQTIQALYSQCNLQPGNN